MFAFQLVTVLHADMSGLLLRIIFFLHLSQFYSHYRIDQKVKDLVNIVAVLRRGKNALGIELLFQLSDLLITYYSVILYVNFICCNHVWTGLYFLDLLEPLSQGVVCAFIRDIEYQ